MKKIYLALALFLAIIAATALYAAITKAPSTVKPATTPIIRFPTRYVNVFCFLDGASTSALIQVVEIDSAGNVVPGTIKSVWDLDGRTSFTLRAYKNYRVSAEYYTPEEIRASRRGYIPLGGLDRPKATQIITNLDHHVYINMNLSAVTTNSEPFPTDGPVGMPVRIRKQDR